MKEFELQGAEYIELNKLLKLMRFVNSGGEANRVIDNREVKVNEIIETQKRKKIRPGDKVEFQGKTIQVK